LLSRCHNLADMTDQKNRSTEPDLKSGCTIALIVAGGRGHRFGGPLPKQYCDLGGVPLLRRTLACFAAHPEIDFIRPVIHIDDQRLFSDACAGIKTLPAVAGGNSRQASVRAGLESLMAMNPARVLIHDAARPFVSGALIDRVLEGLRQHSGVLPALAVTDTLKSAEDGHVTGTVPREGVWAAQTPQGFVFRDILELHRKFRDEEMTDDVGLAEHGAMDVAIVEGDEMNTKITTANDLRVANRMLGPVETRIGQGYDVHRFCPGDHVMLCGVKIPHDKGLDGHSDADVGLHALTDALLGAVGAGDIGLFFPPTEAKWKNVESGVFLRHAAEKAEKNGGRIINVDVTLICERPKMTVYRDEMVKSVADILKITVDRVNIKATTTERLGFTGRNEGIAASAVAAVSFQGRDF